MLKEVFSPSKSLVSLNPKLAYHALNFLIALFLVIMALGFVQARGLWSPPMWVRQYALQGVLGISLVWLFVLGWRPLLSLHKRTLVYVLGVFVCYFSILKFLDVLLSLWMGEESGTSLEGGASIHEIFLLGLIAPLFEELYFRDLFFRALRVRWSGFWIPALFSSLVFMLAHMSVYPGAFLLGVLSAGLVYFSGSIGPSILFHSLSNLSWFFMPFLFPHVFGFLAHFHLLRSFYQ